MLRHIHVSFLTPLLVLFSIWIIFPIQRTLAALWAKHPIGQALAYAGPGF